MNGILVVDKPAGFTSFDVVAKLRGICGTRQIGHGGTLDPMATGVLPVFVGRAAKAVDLAPRQDKAYDAELLFGVATDTGDVTGTVLKAVEANVDRQALEAVLPRFLGVQMQTPPMYSAVKVNGKPLYKYAREGKAVQRKAREITIHSLELLESFDGPRPGVGDGGENTADGMEAAAILAKAGNRFAMHVHCGKGTYVRTLVEDIGAALGVPATLAALRRTQAGVFGLAQASTLQDIQKAKDEARLEQLLCPVASLFQEWPRVAVDEKGKARLLNGAPVYRVAPGPGRCQVWAKQPGGDVFLGLGMLDAEGTLHAEKLFAERE